MKIIHTADLHLDSKLSRYFDTAKAAERRGELLLTFQKMVEYGADIGVSAIIIAGDLFDVRKISATARDAVYTSVLNNPGIEFYYLRGNHDADTFLNQITEKYGSLPENLKMFSGDWKSYTHSEDGVSVVITGAEITAENNERLVDSLSLDRNVFNIVTLHGQEVATAGKKDAEIIPLKSYADRGIDYLALGHIHTPKIAKLDSRCTYSYCGCLEGRGFDECGERGFNLLDISDDGFKVSFVPFAKRTVFDISADVSDCINSGEVIGRIRETAANEGVADKDMLKVRLSGEVSLESEFDLGFIAQSLNSDFYFAKVSDETETFIDYRSFEYDKSLKGEFVRLIKSEQEKGVLSEKEAASCIAMGVRLLMGEEKLS
ncbi:MAG: metallophosphoesterase [Lachnospiraceae bacterium]|nr:metallophosphoesterase [Lachnospiraceae bacterium]